jgi:hypothetical protein
LGAFLAPTQAGAIVDQDTADCSEIGFQLAPTAAVVAEAGLKDEGEAACATEAVVHAVSVNIDQRTRRRVFRAKAGVLMALHEATGERSRCEEPGRPENDLLQDSFPFRWTWKIHRHRNRIPSTRRSGELLRVPFPKRRPALFSSKAGDMPAAAAAFREVLRLSPGNPYAQKGLAAALAGGR